MNREKQVQLICDILEITNLDKLNRVAFVAFREIEILNTSLKVNL